MKSAQGHEDLGSELPQRTKWTESCSPAAATRYRYAAPRGDRRGDLFAPFVSSPGSWGTHARQDGDGAVQVPRRFTSIIWFHSSMHMASIVDSGITQHRRC